jgi:hypothetical protein
MNKIIKYIQRAILMVRSFLVQKFVQRDVKKAKELKIMLRAIKKLLKEKGIELDSSEINNLAIDIKDLADEEIEKASKGSGSKSKDDEAFDPETFKKEILEMLKGKPEDDKKPDDDGVSELEQLKVAHAAELAQIKLDTKLETEFATLKIKDGYQDIVKGLVDMSKVKLNDKGEIEGLKEQTDVIVKEKADLFSVKHQYNPGGGKSLATETDINKAMKSKDFNLTEFLTNSIGDE